MKIRFAIISLSLTFFLLNFSACKEELCDDTCHWPADGECDDGGPNSLNDYCNLGTDCTDCGSRSQ